MRDRAVSTQTVRVRVMGDDLGLERENLFVVLFAVFLLFLLLSTSIFREQVICFILRLLPCWWTGTSKYERRNRGSLSNDAATQPTIPAIQYVRHYAAHLRHRRQGVQTRVRLNSTLEDLRYTRQGGHS